MLAEADGAFDVYEVTVGVGQTLTADLDFAVGVLGGPSFDSELRLFNAAGTELATNDDSLAANGGLGSEPGFASDTSADAFLTWVNTTATAQTYYIRVEQFNDSPIAAGNTYMLGVSVTNHANANTAVQGNDFLDGGAGNDLIIGNDGDDTLIGGTGFDTLNGGVGSDLADFSDGTSGGVIDLVAGSAEFASETDSLISIERVIGTGQNDTITGGTEDNHLAGGGGGDTITASGGDDTLDGGSGGDRLLGGAGEDVMSGGIGNDLLAGNADDDFLDGGASQDTLIGGSGDDTLEGGFGNDVLDGGTGIDTADYTGFGGGITVNLLLSGAQATGAAGTDELSAIENILGGDFNDRFTGLTGATEIDAGAGSDFVFGLGGNDTLDGGDGNDNVNGGNGDDLLFGGNGRDAIVGGGGSDTVFGGIENDQLRGGNGTDTLEGGAGRDVLIGGDFVVGSGFPGDNAADVFVFNDVTESGPGGASRDIIRDFEVGLDIMDVSAIDAIVGGSDNSFAFIGNAAFSGTAGELRYFNAGTNTIVRADVDGDGAADFEVFLNGSFAASASDFVL